MNNKKIKFKLPFYIDLDKPLKLRLPRLELNDVFRAVDFIAILFIILGVIGVLNASQQTSYWVTGLVVFFISRIIRALYFGISVFPQVKYDIPLLSAITGFLLIAVLTGDSETYSDLGGTRSWGIGMLLLSATTLYAIQIYLNQYQTARRYLLHAISLALFILFITNIPSDYSRILDNPSPRQLELALISLFATPLAIQGITRSNNRLAQILNALLFVLLVPFLLVLVINGYFILLGLALILIAIFLPGKTRSALSRLLEDLKKQRSYQPLLGFKEVLIITTIALSILSVFLAPRLLTSIAEEYSLATSSFTELVEIAVGTGLISRFSDGVNLFLSYGAIGLVLAALILNEIIQKIRERKQVDLISLLVALFIASVLLTATSLNVKLIALAAIALLFYERQQLKSIQFNIRDIFERKIFTKIMPAKIWGEVAFALRLLITITLIVFIPSIIGFIQGLFG